MAAPSPQYYNDQVSGAGIYGKVDDLSNWWLDSAFTVPSTEFPDTGTVCHVYGTGLQFASGNYTLSVYSIDLYDYSVLNAFNNVDFYTSNGVTMHDYTQLQADG